MLTNHSIRKETETDYEVRERGREKNRAKIKKKSNNLSEGAAICARTHTDALRVMII